MKYSLSAFLALALSFGAAVGHPRDAWCIKKLTSLVAFGDSYTDENRLGYFGNHDGQAPPVGWVEPESTDASSGGRIWARYVAQYTGANLYNYAVSGAVCSNAISPRTWSSINAPFPAVTEYEVPAFIADSHYRASPRSQPFLNIPVASTVYAMWIGTNDLGNYAFLTDSQIPGATLVDYVNCIYSNFDKLYRNGARFFVLMNNAPLQLAPQYATPSHGGLAATQYWTDKPANITEISYRMWESVVTVNDVFSYKTPFEVLIARRYPGAHFAIYDTNSLLTDIYNHPQNYLNGTAPANVTGYVNHCTINGTDCVRQPSPDSYLWFDPLHPSEQAQRIVAREFVSVVRGQSDFATYWSG